MYSLGGSLKVKVWGSCVKIEPQPCAVQRIKCHLDNRGLQWYGFLVWGPWDLECGVDGLVVVVVLGR